MNLLPSQVYKDDGVGKIRKLILVSKQDSSQAAPPPPPPAGLVLTASYSAVPSMLMVAPTGITNREILRSMLLFSSTHFRVTGMVALLESVPNAVAIAAKMRGFTSK